MIKAIKSLIPEDLFVNHPGLESFADGFIELMLLVLKIVCIIVVTKIVVFVIKKILNAVFSKKLKDGEEKNQRLETAKSLISYIGKFAVYFVAVCALLDAVGLGKTVTSLIATAGIGGIAIGFGAQSLVKDFFTGIFLVFEGQIQIGDVVTVAGLTGVVEEMQLRTTKLRASTGELHTIPNGNITNVTNYTRGGICAMVDVPVPYENTVEEVTKVIEEAMDKYAANSPELIEKPKVIGVTEFGASAVVLRVVATVRKQEQGIVEREIRQYVLTAFKENNLSIPYNKLEILKNE